jgi:hypothetical protein
MNPVSVLKGRDVGPKAADREARRGDDLQTPCELISLLSYLEADNQKLWKAVRELSIETAALRQALKTMESRWQTVEPKRTERRRPRRLLHAVAETRAAETGRLPFGR